MPGIRLIISGTWNRLRLTPINLRAKMIKCSTLQRDWMSPTCSGGLKKTCSVQNRSIFFCLHMRVFSIHDLNRGRRKKRLGSWGKYRHKNIAVVSKKKKKLQQSQLHLNVSVLSETRLRRGTSLFTLKLCTLAITKPGYPLQTKGFGRLMHSWPLFTAQTTLSKTTLHFNSLGVWQAKHMKDGGFF